MQTTVKIRLVPKSVLGPSVDPDAALIRRAPRLERLEGKTIVFWHDSTPEADIIFPVIERFLQERGVRKVVVARQPGPAFPPLESNLQKVRDADAAIAGVAW